MSKTVTFACVGCTAIKEGVPVDPAKSEALPPIAHLPEGWAYGRFWWQIVLSGIIRECYLPLCLACRSRSGNATQFSATATAEVARLREGVS